MYQNQRRSVDNRNKSYIDEEMEQISLNYTSSIKTNNKDGRARFYSSHEKPDKKYDYSNDFMEVQNTPTGTAYPYHIS